MEDDPMEGDLMEDNPRTIELDKQAVGGTNESASLKEAEVGMDTHQEDSIDCDMQVEAMVQLLEEGLDRLKISVNVAKPALPGLDGSSKIPSGVTMPLHSGSDGPGTTGLTVLVGPSQATAMPDLETTTANQSSFHKMAKIIRELTKMVKVRTDTEGVRAAIEKFVNNCETGTVHLCSGQPLLLLSLRSLVT